MASVFSKFRSNVIIQLFTIGLFSLILSRSFLQGVEFITFEPGDWGHRFEEKKLGVRIKDQAPLLSNFAQNDNAQPCFAYPTNDGSNIKHSVYCAYIGTEFNTCRSERLDIVVNGTEPALSCIYVLRGSFLAQDDTLDTAETASLPDEIRRAPLEKWILNQSTWDGIFGVRSNKVVAKSVYRLGAQLESMDETIDPGEGNTGLRWLQALIDAANAGVRWNNLFVGFIQLFIYVFSFIVITLLIIDVNFVRRNRNYLNKSKQKTPIINQGIVSRKEVETTLENLQKDRQQEMNARHPEFEPPIVFDTLILSYRDLLSYPSEVNRGDLVSGIDVQVSGLKERLERRYNIIHYFVSSLPSLGFLGTVWGISHALGLTSALTNESLPYERLLANEALGDSLMVAFDTTLIALVLHLLLSFFSDLVENREMALTLDIKQFAVSYFSKILRLTP